MNETVLDSKTANCTGSLSVPASLALIALLNPLSAWPMCEAARTQVEVNQCGDTEYRQNLQTLESLTAAYERRLTPAQLTLFRKTQADWESYRRSACDFATSGVKDGSVYPLAMSVCQSAKVQERISEIQALSNCEEGNSLCPAWKSGN